MIRTRCLMLPLVITLAVLISTTASGDHSANTSVDSQSIESDSTVPAVSPDDIFVPVLPFAEMLGAVVEWDSSARTLFVSTPGETTTLYLDGSAASTGTTPVRFLYPPYPPRDRLRDPILFFSEDFDQAWYWDPLRREFKWIPIFPRWRGGMSPPSIIYGPGRTVRPEESPPIPATRAVVGEVVRVLPSRTNPRIVVNTDGRNVTYPVARDAIVVRGRVGGQGMELPLGSLLPGDRVTLRFAEDDTVISIRAQYRLTMGRVRAIAEGTILLGSGETLRVTEQTEILLPDNSQGDVQHIGEGDEIVASVSPSSGRTYTIKLLTTPEVPDGVTPTTDDPITLSTVGPLGVGDPVVVQFRALAGGEAWFTIPGARANIPMAEVEPGLYRGEYMVSQGDMTLRQPVKVHFLAPDGESYSRLSSQVITIETVPGFLPRIASPRHGEEIDSPVVVTGIAEPGALVRVTIEYRRDALRLLPIRGLTAVEDLRADANGRWQTPPMAATAPFAERFEDIPPDFGIFTELFRLPEEPPIIFTITATSIGPAGEARASYRVEVTSKPGRRLGGLMPSPVELSQRSVG